MINTIVTIRGYGHLYRSLLRFSDMQGMELREMLYTLNTANLDCYEYCHPERSLTESSFANFSVLLENLNCRPYRTEVQLYKSLLFLKRSIDRSLITTAQKEALRKLCCIIANIEHRFYKAYGVEIDDKRTVYGECAYQLVPNYNEPCLCLTEDCVCLRGA